MSLWRLVGMAALWLGAQTLPGVAAAEETSKSTEEKKAEEKKAEEEKFAKETRKSITADEIGTHMSPALVGDMLAVELLGASDVEAIRPTSLQAAFTELRGLIGPEGKLAPGFALELSPWLIAGSGITADEYTRLGFLKQNLLRSGLSIAVVGDGEGESAGVRSAAALRLRILDDSDWVNNTDAVNCVREAIRPAPVPGKRPDESIVEAPVTEEDLAAVKACREKHVPWNSRQAALGVAVITESPGGVVKDSRLDSMVAWLAGTWGLGTSGQFVLSGRYTFHQGRVDSSGSTEKARHVGGVGGRLVYKREGWALNLDLGGGAELQGETIKGKGLVGLTAQLKATEALWVETGVDFNLTGRSSSSGFLLTTSLKWKFDISPSDKSGN